MAEEIDPKALEAIQDIEEGRRGSGDGTVDQNSGGFLQELSDSFDDPDGPIIIDGVEWPNMDEYNKANSKKEIPVLTENRLEVYSNIFTDNPKGESIWPDQEDIDTWDKVREKLNLAYPEQNFDELPIVDFNVPAPPDRSDFPNTRSGAEKYIDAKKEYDNDINNKGFPILEKSAFDDRFQKVYDKLGANPLKKSSSDTVNKTIIPANNCTNDFFSKIENYMDGFFKILTSGAGQIVDIQKEINSMTDLINATSQRFIGNITNLLNDKITDWLRFALDGIEKFFFATIPEKLTAIATIKGVQFASVGPINLLFEALGCVVGKAKIALKGVIKDMLLAASKNILNPIACAAQQFVGALTSKITSVIDSLVGPWISPIEKIFSPIGAVFNVKNTIMGGINIMKKIQGLFSCKETEKCPTTKKITIGGKLGKGKGGSEEQNVIDKVFKAANGAIGEIDNAKDQIFGGVETGLTNFEEAYGKWEIFGSKLGDATGGQNLVGGCDTDNVFACGMPKIEFFGGEGVDAAGEVLLGKVINRFDNEDLFGDIQKTASIVGVNITDPGSGYTEEPLVAFTDSCDKGYGGYGKAVIDKDMTSPTYGQIIGVTIVSSGENYPVGEYEESDLYVKEIIVENGGSGYQEGDSLDDFDICGLDENGSITKVCINNRPYRALPNLNISTLTGSGAVLRPIMTKQVPQTAIVEVVDCVTQ